MKEVQYNQKELNSEPNRKHSDIHNTNSGKKFSEGLQIGEISPSYQQKNDPLSENENARMPPPQFAYKKGKFCSLCKIDFSKNISISILPCEFYNKAHIA